MCTAKFTAEQRRELLEMTVPPRKRTKDQQRHRKLLLLAQIDELEGIALPSIIAFLLKQPQKNDVVDELTELAQAMKSAERAIGALLGGSHGSANDVPPKLAASKFIWLASYKAGAVGDELDNARQALNAALRVVAAARKFLPTAATRPRTGASYPVWLIDTALLTGFLKAHGHWPGTGGPGAATPLPPYEIKTSYDPGSNFRGVVEICYAAAGLESSGERAIRAFMRPDKRRTEAPIKI